VKRLIAPLVLVVAVVIALVLTAGGGEERPAETASDPAAPRISIPRLGGGDTYQLASLNEAKAPTLLWFWAPWCPVCNAEAPNIEALAKDLDVVAIGGRDEASTGPAFASEHGLRTPTLLFDEAMTSWEHYRIVGQPGAVLLDRDGVEQARWSGPLDNAAVLAAAKAL
jgi:thiol-disulfide isomerase/thioredoxin